MSTPQATSAAQNPNLDTAVVGGGCFWCVEAVFQRISGVHGIRPGYAGGQTPNPTYKAICTGTTGHAEVAEITYDPAVLSYADLLYVFFRTHNPTTPNRQGNDVGTQYRSIIMPRNAQQRETAQRVLQETEAAKVWPDPIVTEVTDLETFYPAEDYHHNYYNANRSQPYCALVIDPKVNKLRKDQDLKPYVADTALGEPANR